MKVALGIAATESEVTAALVDIDLPSLGPVDERITPLNAKSATVGDAVAAAIGVMRLRAIQNGLDLQSTMVSSATRVQRESISSALGMHKIEGVDVVDAANLSSAFEPSVATALWNAESADLATADSTGSAKPVKASRMEKFGKAHRARSAEKAAGKSESQRSESQRSKTQRSDVRVDEPAPVPRNAVDLEKPSRTVKASSPTPVSGKTSTDVTSAASTVSRAELDIPLSIASPPAAKTATAEPETKPAEPKPAEPKPAEPETNGVSRSLNLGERSVPERVSTNGSAAVKDEKSSGNSRTYSGVSSHADTTDTTVIDSAAIVAAVGDSFLIPATAPAPAPAARRRLRPPPAPQMDEWDSPMTEPIGIVGPMATRASEVGSRERGAALIVGGVLALVFAALVAAWALSGGGDSSETDAPGNAAVTGPLTSETSAAAVPQTSASTSTSVAVPGSVAPSSTNPAPGTDTGTSTGEVLDPSTDVEGAPASASPSRSTRVPSERTGSSSVATNEVSAPVNSGSVAGRPATGGGSTVSTKATANPVATAVQTAPTTVSTDPVTPTDPSTSGQTGAGGGNSGGGGSGGDLSPTTASDK